MTNVGRAEVARLKDLNSQARLDAQQLHGQLDSLTAELDTARARITELEAALSAAAAAPAAAPAPLAKSSVSEDRHSAVEEGVSAQALDAAPQEAEGAPRNNPFKALGDIGLGEAAAQLVAHAGEHGYAIVFGADSAEGEPSARSQLVETAAAALTAAGVAVAVHKIDISGMDDGSAFVVVGEDGTEVRAWLLLVCVCSSLIDVCACAGARPVRCQPAAARGGG